MTNGSNSYGVTLPQIQFLSRILTHHSHVEDFARENDIQFNLTTTRGLYLRLICVNEYTCGLLKVLQVQGDFPRTNIVYVGGAWNSYTMQAKEHCIHAEIGLFNATEINGALFHDDYWLYCRRDREGNPVYNTKFS
jgi:hypothetical protein